MNAYGLGPAPPARGAPLLDDEFLESYVSWREEAGAVQRAYDRWQAAEETDEVLAFAAYQAALDREEQAAKLLCKSAGRIGVRSFLRSP